MVRIAEFGGKEQRELGGDYVTKKDASIMIYPYHVRN